MTVKLALFLLRVLASVPGTSKMVESGYPPLDSWIETTDGYTHFSTGRLRKRLPRDVIILDNPIDDMATIYVEDVGDINHEKRNGWILTTHDGQRIVMTDTPRLRRREHGEWYHLKKTGYSFVRREPRQRVDTVTEILPPVLFNRILTVVIKDTKFKL